MIIKCYAEDCLFNINKVCSKEEIEINNVSAYDEDSAECVDYEKKE